MIKGSNQLVASLRGWPLEDLKDALQSADGAKIAQSVCVELWKIGKKVGFEYTADNRECQFFVRFEEDIWALLLPTLSDEGRLWRLLNCLSLIAELAKICHTEGDNSTGDAMLQSLIGLRLIDVLDEMGTNEEYLKGIRGIMRHLVYHDYRRAKEKIVESDWSESMKSEALWKMANCDSISQLRKVITENYASFQAALEHWFCKGIDFVDTI